MEIDNPFNDFLVICEHDEQGPEPALIARILGDSDLITQRNTGLGSIDDGNAGVMENTRELVGKFSCTVCGHDLQLRPSTLAEFVRTMRKANQNSVSLAALEKWATRR